MNQKSRLFSLMQRLGQSLMLPVSVLPAAGLVVALGRLLQGQAGPDAALTPALWFGKLFYAGGLAIFEQLPTVFAVGVAIGFTGGAGAAGLSAVVGYFTLINLLKVLGELNHLTSPINTGVFGGIMVGLLTAALYRRFHETKLPTVFGFFSGKRLVPIVTVAATLVLGVVLGYVWPPIQDGINHFGATVMGSSLGPAFYAAGKRLLIPVGLHHVYYPPFLYQFGEFVAKSGQVLHGDSARYFGGDATAGLFMAAEFPLMLFGLPAAALAMTLRAKPENRKMVGGIMLSAALTSIITGITEPIEFAFIFVAPPLYILHVGLAFISGLLTHAFDIHLGYTFSASLIDFVIGFFNQKNSFYLWALVGPVVALAYFGGFYALIGWMDFKTPGRETEEQPSEAAATLRAKPSEKARLVLQALGGAANLTQLDACITRLRVSVRDSGKVDAKALKALGAAGLMKADAHNLQVIFGTESDLLKEQIRKLLDSSEPVVAALAPLSAGVIVAPLSGRVVPITDVPDETFAGRILGDGIAIEPDRGLVVAPFDGTVANLFRTKHAIGLISNEGVELLIHIGIDTVKMGGEGFKALVSDGQQVHAGDPLIEFDLELVRSKAKSVISPVVVTNIGEFKGLRVLFEKGTVASRSPLLEIQN